ncbi:hypothetical protein Tco_0312101 [Tanacetum coccineum]
MSDSDESGVTHTEVSSPFEDLSDIGSPRADDHEYLELPYIPEDLYLEAALQAPPSPDYVPGPEEPEQAPLSPDYVPGPEHADDEIVAEDQSYAEAASPAAQSPDYVPDTNSFDSENEESLIPDTLDHSKFLNELTQWRTKLELPKKLSSIHISNLKKCLSDESFLILIKEL